MRILFLGNNWVGWQILQWLKKRGEEIAGLVIHPPERRKFGEEIIRTAQVRPECIFDGSKLNRPEILDEIKMLNCDIGVSVLFGYILRSEFLELLPAGVVNLHPALLPYNRGAYPNVWSIIDGTPAGVTLHYIDSGVDTGDIIAQRNVDIEPIDTGETLYRKLEKACVDLFKDTWQLICNGQAPRIKQHTEAGTYHKVQDVERIDKIELGRLYTAKELIDIIRARTFPPYLGAYFEYEGKRIYLRLQLFYGESTSKGGKQ